MTTTTALAILSGIFWTITYLLIIRRSIQDQSVGIPLVAMCMNISWEFIFSFVFPSRKPQLYINYVWFLLELVIVMQFLKFGKFEFSGSASNKRGIGRVEGISHVQLLHAMPFVRSS